MLVYTDEDIRLDLLLPAERQIYPKELTAEDRKQILAITRDRADSVDWDGNIILAPEQWIAEYRKNMGMPTMHQDPQLKPVIRRDVVVPSSGVVESVDAGLADVVQRLLDRGVVVNCGVSSSGMVTDHPGMRLVAPANDSGALLSDLKPGDHLHGHKTFVSTALEFPTNNHKKEYNNPQIAEAIAKAAVESGFVVSTGATGALRISLPCCMDGTDKEQVYKETEDLMADDSLADRAALKEKTHEVVNSHGGIAIYTDTMIQDRLARFGRALERKFIADRNLGQKQPVPEVNYDDFLLASQIADIQKQGQQKARRLWIERAAPYIYHNYKEPPEKVDLVARMAGYKDYHEYMQNRMNRQPDNKRMSVFRKLEKKMLHTDEQGMLKLYRINNGISRALNDWVQEQSRRMAEPVMEHHRNCGYPMDKIREISIVTGTDGRTTLFVEARDKRIAKPVSEDTWVRLLNDACTPFELAVETVGRELGWNGKLNFNVTLDTVRMLDLNKLDGNGRMPLTYDGHVYKVNAYTWQHAWMLTRFSQMPESLQKQLLDIHPPKRDVTRLDADELKCRFETMDRKLLTRVSQARLNGLDNGSCALTCTVDGTKLNFTAKMDEIELRDKLLPDMDVGVLHRQLVAAKLGLNVMEEGRSNSMKR